MLLERLSLLEKFSEIPKATVDQSSQTLNKTKVDDQNDVFIPDCRWLTDTDINNVFIYLKEIYDINQRNILLMDPIIATLIRANGIGAKSHLDALKINTFDFIAIPVNNCDPLVNQGSHWSLLIYDKSNDAFFHFDSVSGINQSYCHQIISNLAVYLSITNHSFSEIKCATQFNSYDCGIYLIHFSWLLMCHGNHEFDAMCQPPTNEIRQILVYLENKTSQPIIVPEMYSQQHSPPNKDQAKTQINSPISLPPIKADLCDHPKSSKVFLLGDSHLRKITPLVLSEVNNVANCKIFGCFKPGANFDNVTFCLNELTSNFTKNDYVYILAGTNDMLAYHEKGYCDFNLEILSQCAIRTNLNLILIPYRFDDEYQFLNRHIYAANHTLIKFAIQHNINYIDTSVFDYSYFSRHGLHLNLKGKKKLASLISQDIISVFIPGQIEVIVTNRVFRNRKTIKARKRNV